MSEIGRRPCPICGGTIVTHGSVYRYGPEPDDVDADVSEWCDGCEQIADERDRLAEAGAFDS